MTVTLNTPYIYLSCHSQLILLFLYLLLLFYFSARNSNTGIYRERGMERYKLAPNFNGNLSRRTTAPSYISLPPKPHLQEPTTNTRHRLAIPAKDADIFDAERYFNDGIAAAAAAKRTIILDSIAASADRCDLSNNPRDSSASSIDCFRRSGSSFHATPTSSSEASWNSQSGLLTHHQSRFVAVKVRGFPLHEHQIGAGHASPAGGRRFFRRRCPCSGEKSVDVEERYSEPPKTPIRSNHDPKSSSKRVEAIHFPPPKSPVRATIDPKPSYKTEEEDNCFPPPKSSVPATQDASLSAKPEPAPPTAAVEEVIKLKIVAGTGSGLFSPERGRRLTDPRRHSTGGVVGFTFPILSPPVTAEEPPRDSLEVFRPATHDGDRRSFNSRQADDDVASDTSSDLFEIESFTSQMTAYRRRDSFDEAAAAAGGRFRPPGGTPSVAASECYPPSEVSVEWSVTTVEGFDRASVANLSIPGSDYGELRFIQEEHDRFAAAAAGGGGGRKKGGGGLMSCVCEKAVSVGPSPVRFPTPPAVAEQGRAAAGFFWGAEPDRGSGRSGLTRNRSGIERSHSARMFPGVQRR